MNQNKNEKKKGGEKREANFVRPTKMGTCKNKTKKRGKKCICNIMIQEEIGRLYQSASC